jgi:hypothetical protein
MTAKGACVQARAFLRIAQVCHRIGSANEPRLHPCMPRQPADILVRKETLPGRLDHIPTEWRTNRMFINLNHDIPRYREKILDSI